MRRFVFGLLLLSVCGSALAQQQPPPGLPTPRIQHVFPLGAKAGPAPEIRQLGLTIKLDTELTVTGTDLDEPENLLFSHPGIKADSLAPKAHRPTPRRRTRRTPPKGGPGPHKFRVTVDPAVPPGTYDVRFVGKWGVSNPRAFVVSGRNEVNENEPNNDVPEAQRVPIGTTVSGVIASPTDVDYTLFAGKKGQRVLISCVSASIDGRASPLVEVYDSSGRKLGHNRGYRDNDALADVLLPADGEYLVRLSQFAYQGGGPDYFYRLTITTGPWIDAVFPPAIEPGKPTQVTLYGRNLPNSQPADGFTVDGRPLEKLAVTITPPTDAAGKLVLRGRIDPATALQDGFEYVFKGPNGMSNPVPIYLARDKLVVKKGPSSTQAARRVDRRAVRGGRVLFSPRRRGLVRFRREEGRPVPDRSDRRARRHERRLLLLGPRRQGPEARPLRRARRRQRFASPVRVLHANHRPARRTSSPLPTTASTSSWSAAASRACSTARAPRTACASRR